MRILGIESSCDETGIAIVEDGRRVIVHGLSSQADIHARFGGVVPEIASRQHLLTFPTLLRDVMQRHDGDLNLDAIAVTYGPGLAGSLLVGVKLWPRRWLWRGIFRSMASTTLRGMFTLTGLRDGQWDGEERGDPILPAVALIVSGGHTDIVLIETHGQYRLLSETRDDAAGEAFDKVARLLGLGYPGGPIIEHVARDATDPIRFPSPLIRDSWDFSFSGLKTAQSSAWSTNAGAQSLYLKRTSPT